MDPHYHIFALREVRFMVNRPQPARGSRAGAATLRGDNGLDSPSRPPACCVGRILTGNHGRNDRDRRDQTSARHLVDHSRARTAANNRAAQRRIRLRKRRDQ